jgi:uncharacterized protein YodC (DUF2158 family)
LKGEKMSEFKKGDVVKLKSGGPDMTIVEIGEFGYDPTIKAKCHWFEGTKRKEELFLLNSLQEVRSSN